MILEKNESLIVKRKQKILVLMSSAGTPQRHVVTVRCDHHCVNRGQTELFVPGGKEGWG